MSGRLTVEQMRSNIAQSEQHISKQEAIIDRLLTQGHLILADEARKLLTTMRAHLATERDMLALIQAR